MLKNVLDTNNLNKYGIRFDFFIDVWMSYYYDNDSQPKLESLE